MPAHRIIRDYERRFWQGRAAELDARGYVMELQQKLQLVEKERDRFILAGPNGAGKSIAAPELLRGELAVTEFVNADVIARGLSAFNPDHAWPIGFARAATMFRPTQSGGDTARASETSSVCTNRS